MDQVGGLAEASQLALIELSNQTCSASSGDLSLGHF
jgi:hypothetical protein